MESENQPDGLTKNESATVLEERKEETVSLDEKIVDLNLENNQIEDLNVIIQDLKGNPEDFEQVNVDPNDEKSQSPSPNEAEKELENNSSEESENYEKIESEDLNLNVDQTNFILVQEVLTDIKEQDAKLNNNSVSIMSVSKMDNTDEQDLYDCIIVGAGLSGASAAYYLKKKSNSLKILVIEAKNRCGGGNIKLFDLDLHLNTDLKSLKKFKVGPKLLK
jgi:hypothetical protein